MSYARAVPYSLAFAIAHGRLVVNVFAMDVRVILLIQRRLLC